MATSISNGARIRTNTPAENAYNSLFNASQDIANRQLRLSTGKRVNSAADDVAAYITAKSLAARNGSLQTALRAAGEAMNVTAIVQDAYENINGLLTSIKDAAAQAATGALGTDEKVALAKGAFRLAQQIQMAVDSTIFGGKQLLQGAYSGSWVIGYYANDELLKLKIDLTTNVSGTISNTNVTDFNTGNIFNIKHADNGFDLNAVGKDSGDSNVTSTITAATAFAGVQGLNLTSFNEVSSTNLGIFSTDNITKTLQSLAEALGNLNNTASYVGGVQVRIGAQEDLLRSQITNYNSAISRLQDADVAAEQLALIKAQFLQQTSIISLTQANQAPQQYLQMFR